MFLRHGAPGGPKGVPLCSRQHHLQGGGGLIKMQTPKTKRRATIQSCNPTPGHTSGETHNSKRYTHPGVHCSTIYDSQDTEAT